MSRKTLSEDKKTNDNRGNKRPSLLTRVLDFDIWLTGLLAVCASPESKYGFLRPFCKFLEYSGDGALWLPVVIIWNLVSHQMSMHHKLMNMLVGEYGRCSEYCLPQTL